MQTTFIELIQMFDKRSNSQQTPEQLTVLHSDERYMLVGSINKAFNISLDDLSHTSVDNGEISSTAELSKQKQTFECNQKLNVLIRIAFSFCFLLFFFFFFFFLFKHF